MSATETRPARSRPGGTTSPRLRPANVTVAAVAALAADDDHATTTRHPRRGREPRDDRLGGATPGVLHERRAGDAELPDRALVDPAHLLAGEDGTHGSASRRQRGRLRQELGEDREVGLARIGARHARKLEPEHAGRDARADVGRLDTNVHARHARMPAQMRVADELVERAQPRGETLVDAGGRDLDAIGGFMATAGVDLGVE